jgi:hypothetical protein
LPLSLKENLFLQKASFSNAYKWKLYPNELIQLEIGTHLCQQSYSKPQYLDTVVRDCHTTKYYIICKINPPFFISLYWKNRKKSLSLLLQNSVVFPFCSVWITAPFIFLFPYVGKKRYQPLSLILQFWHTIVCCLRNYLNLDMVFKNTVGIH